MLRCVACRHDDLRKIFEKFGEIKDVYIPKDYHSGEQREFAYIQFVDARDASDAVRGLRDGPALMGRTLQVAFARTDRKTPDEMAKFTEGKGNKKRYVTWPVTPPLSHAQQHRCPLHLQLSRRSAQSKAPQSKAKRSEAKQSKAKAKGEAVSRAAEGANDSKRQRAKEKAKAKVRKKRRAEQCAEWRHKT